MSGVNKVIILGKLGNDPDVKYGTNGNAITNISVATSETWKDKTSGEKQEKTEWHRIIFFGKLAEIAGQYLRKGSQVYVEGKLQTRKWQDNSGNDRYTTEIIGAEMQMLGSKSDSDTSGSSSQGQQSYQKPSSQSNNNRQSKPQSFDDFDDD